MKAKQSAIDLIFENFNLLSDADFKSWMLNNQDGIKQMGKNQIIDAYYQGAEDEASEHGAMILDLTDAERYYNDYYINNNE